MSRIFAPQFLVSLSKALNGCFVFYPAFQIILIRSICLAQATLSCMEAHISVLCSRSRSRTSSLYDQFLYLWKGLELSTEGQAQINITFITQNIKKNTSALNLIEFLTAFLAFHTFPRS